MEPTITTAVTTMALTTTTAQRANTSALGFTGFIWLLAAAVFSHHFVCAGDALLITGPFMTGPTDHLPLIAAFQLIPMGLSVAVLFRPGNARLVFAFVSSNLLLIVLEGGTIVNHWIAEGMMMALVLAIFVSEWYRQRRFPDSLEGFGEKCLGAIRYFPIILFFWAAFHKINTDFFDPERSCAAEHYLNLGWLFGRLPNPLWLRQILPYVTVFVEFGYALLLLVPRTRVLGVLLALPFHFAMSLNGWVMFGTMFIVFYACFAPHDFWRFAGRAWGPRLVRGYLSWLSAALYLGFAAISIAVLARPSIVADRAVIDKALAGLWGGTLFHFPPRVVGVLAIDVHSFVVGIGVVGFQLFLALIIPCYAYWYFARRKRARATAPGPAMGRARSPGAPVSGALRWCRGVTIGLMIANGVMPYLGFRTAAVFSMFSNLKTEGGVSNHLVIPKSFQIWDEPDRLVRIRSLELPELPAHRTRSLYYLDRTRKLDARIVESEFRRHIYYMCKEFADGPPIRISYEANGALVHEPDVCRNRSLNHYDPVLGGVRFFKLVNEAGCPWG